MKTNLTMTSPSLIIPTSRRGQACAVNVGIHLLLALVLMALAATPLFAHTATYILYMEMIHEQAGPIGPIQISGEGETVDENEVWEIPGYNLAEYGLGEGFQLFMDGIAGSTIQIEEGGLDQNVVIHLILKNLIVTGGGEAPLQFLGIANPDDLAQRNLWMFADLQVWSEAGEQINAEGHYDFGGDAKMVMNFPMDDEFDGMLADLELGYDDLAMAYWLPDEENWENDGIETVVVGEGDNQFFRVSFEHLSQIGGAGENVLDAVLNVPGEYETIQAAIDAASDGDTVLVAPGEYNESIDFLGKEIAVIGRPSDPSSVILDGQGLDASGVHFRTNENRQTVLDGFSIRNCTGTDYWNNNFGRRAGGAIQIIDASPTLRNLIISGNSASWGGGMFCAEGANPLISTARFIGNRGDGSGGAINARSSGIEIEGCVFFRNESGAGNQFTGELHFYQVEGSILNSVFHRGGVFFQSQSEINLVNSIFDHVQVNIEDAQLIARYSNGIEGETNIDSDPLFLDPDNGDFHLNNLSPCIDSGDPESELDPDGTRTDMGAFYLHQTFHRIPLRQGWNMLSAFNQPRTATIPDVWSEVVTRGNLYMAKNQTGQFYRPGVFNNMAPWDVRQGYMAKALQPDTLVIVNVPTAVGTPIPLRQGWNLVAYFPEDNLDVRDALAGIIDDVLLVKDINGRFYRPANNFSNMPPMTRGMGYQLGVSRATELVYPVGGEVVALASSRHVPPPSGRQDRDFPEMPVEPAARMAALHFRPVTLTGANMSIIVNCKLQIVKSGEIGVFTEAGLCVGSTGVSAGQTAAEGGATVGLAIWADDPTTAEIDGAVEGEALTFKLWNGQAETPVLLSTGTVNLRESESSETLNLRFETDGFAEAMLDVGSQGLAPLPTAFALYSAFPNPFNSTTLIRFDLPKSSQIGLTITDLAGREIVRLVDENRAAGSHSVLWSAGNQPSGVYLVKLKTTLGTRTQKVLLIR